MCVCSFDSSVLVPAHAIDCALVLGDGQYDFSSVCPTRYEVDIRTCMHARMCLREFECERECSCR